MSGPRRRMFAVPAVLGASACSSPALWLGRWCQPSRRAAVDAGMCPFGPAGHQLAAQDLRRALCRGVLEEYSLNRKANVDSWDALGGGRKAPRRRRRHVGTWLTLSYSMRQWRTAITA